jgi:hypothetical protein
MGENPFDVRNHADDPLGGYEQALLLIFVTALKCFVGTGMAKRKRIRRMIEARWFHAIYLLESARLVFCI